MNTAMLPRHICKCIVFFSLQFDKNVVYSVGAKIRYCLIPVSPYYLCFSLLFNITLCLRLLHCPHLCFLVIQDPFYRAHARITHISVVCSRRRNRRVTPDELDEYLSPITTSKICCKTVVQPRTQRLSRQVRYRCTTYYSQYYTTCCGFLGWGRCGRTRTRSRLVLLKLLYR